MEWFAGMMDSSDSSISDIPDEVLQMIFAKLPPIVILSTVVKVCGRWKNIIHFDVRFWNKLLFVIDCDNFINLSNLNNYDDNNENEIYLGQNDLSIVPNIYRLKLVRGDKAVTHPSLLVVRVLDTVRKTCANIQFFEFVQCYGATSSMFLQFLNKHYKHIVEMKFGINCVYSIPYEELSKFGNLTTLISHDYRFRSSDLSCIADSCSQLKRLWVLFTRAIKNDDVLYFLEQKKNMIEEIGLGARLGDGVLSKASECSMLKVLFLCDARDVTENGLSCLAQLSSLKYISLHRINVCTATLTNWISLMEPQRINVIDLTHYTHGDCEIMKTILKNRNITFNNDVQKAILGHPLRVHESSIHWMYINQCNINVK